MKAKTLNVNSPLFTHMKASDGSGRVRRVLVRLDHDGERFVIREAYLHVTKSIGYGTVAEHLPFLNTLINEWYNADMDFERGALFAEGYVSIVDNHEFARQFAEVEAAVALMTTKREQKEALKLNAK